MKNPGGLSNKTVGDLKKENETQHKAEIELSKGDNPLTNIPKKLTPRTTRRIQGHKNEPRKLGRQKEQKYVCTR